MKVSRDERDVIVAHSLGSCVGLTLYDRVAKVGGVIHCMLPVSRSNPQRARLQPAVFADTGVAALLQSLFDYGAERRSLVAKLAGAASMHPLSGVFRIGEANQAIVRKVLWKNDILLSGQDVGGSSARTLVLEMASGKTIVKSRGRKKVL